jgi:hypothetical protein
MEEDMSAARLDASAVAGDPPDASAPLAPPYQSASGPGAPEAVPILKALPSGPAPDASPSGPVPEASQALRVGPAPSAESEAWNALAIAAGEVEIPAEWIVASPEPVPVGGGPEAPFLDTPPEPDTPVKVCSRGHVNPADAVVCLNPECLENIMLAPIVPFAERGGAVRDPVGAGDAEPPVAPEPSGAGEDWDQIEIFYPEEEQLVLRVADGGSFAVRSGDVVGRLGKGEDLLKGFPTVSRRHLSVEFRGGRWYARNLSDNGTYVNGRGVAEVGEELELKPGDELGLSTRCSLKVDR